MACTYASETDQYHGWECSVTEGECMFMNPDSRLCAEMYGEGPDACKKEPKRFIRIFRIDDISWYAAHSIMEFLNWYHKNVEIIECPDELQGMEMFDPEDGTMWSTENVTQEDLEKIGEYDEVCRGGIGDLKRIDGEVFKMQTFADILGDKDISEPFEIASSEF